MELINLALVFAIITLMIKSIDRFATLPLTSRSAATPPKIPGGGWLRGPTLLRHEGVEIPEWWQAVGGQRWHYAGLGHASSNDVQFGHCVFTPESKS